MDVKTTLFEDTLYYWQQWQQLKPETVRHTKFCTCYSIIEECGLEDEYQKWKAGRTNEQH